MTENKTKPIIMIHIEMGQYDVTIIGNDLGYKFEKDLLFVWNKDKEDSEIQVYKTFQSVSITRKEGDDARLRVV